MIRPGNDFGSEYRVVTHASNVKCACCLRKFAAGYVPGPMMSGPYRGLPVCRDCRHDLEQAGRDTSPQLFDTTDL